MLPDSIAPEQYEADYDTATTVMMSAIRKNRMDFVLVALRLFMPLSRFPFYVPSLGHRCFIRSLYACRGFLRERICLPILIVCGMYMANTTPYAANLYSDWISVLNSAWAMTAEISSENVPQ